MLAPNCNLRLLADLAELIRTFFTKLQSEVQPTVEVQSCSRATFMEAFERAEAAAYRIDRIEVEHNVAQRASDKQRVTAPPSPSKTGVYIYHCHLITWLLTPLVAIDMAATGWCLVTANSRSVESLIVLPDLFDFRSQWQSYRVDSSTIDVLLLLVTRTFVLLLCVGVYGCTRLQRGHRLSPMSGRGSLGEHQQGRAANLDEMRWRHRAATLGCIVTGLCFVASLVKGVFVFQSLTAHSEDSNGSGSDGGAHAAGHCRNCASWTTRFCSPILLSVVIPVISTAGEFFLLGVFTYRYNVVSDAASQSRTWIQRQSDIYGSSFILFLATVNLCYGASTSWFIFFNNYYLADELLLEPTKAQAFIGTVTFLMESHDSSITSISRLGLMWNFVLLQINMVIIIRPLCGMISDNVPICGSTRSVYFCIACTVSSGCYLALYQLEPITQVGPVSACLLLGTANVMGYAWCGVLLYAIVAEVSRPTSHTAIPFHLRHRPSESNCRM